MDYLIPNSIFPRGVRDAFAPEPPGTTVSRVNARHRRGDEESPPPAKTRGLGLHTIRGKLAMILAIPTVLLMALAGAGVLTQLGTSRDAATTGRNVELVLATQELIHALQKERGLTNGLLGGRAPYRPEVDAQRLRSDAARGRLDALIADQDIPGVPRVRSALDRLGALASMRGSVDAGQASRTGTFSFYTSAIYALGDAPYDDEVGQSNPRLRNGLAALKELGRAKEAMAQERGLLNGVFATGAFTADEYIKFAELRATKSDALTQFAEYASPEEISALSAAHRSEAATTAAALEERAVTGSSGRQLGINARTWWDSRTTVVDALRKVPQGVGDDVTSAAQAEKDDATRLLIALLAVAGVIVIGAFLLGIVTSRSIIKPLDQLTLEANDVAEHRLPAAVARIQAADFSAQGNTGDFVSRVDSALARRRDEFAAVAGALINVHETAVRLAAEQAVLRRNTAESLANLGRRNQNLVRRQLGFISALEREESDPNALANLFELDHLATRMRRNAESLLVLVGEQSPRRQAEPVAVGDVLRSALSEVEDYRRVVLRRVDDALVRGAVVAEVAHLLAELIENALVYSPPDQDVEIQARGDATQYHIAVVDQGVGMPADELETANARLRGERSFLVAPARYLGHYVVGRLARRLGIKVWLHDSPLAGITARVVLPAELMVGGRSRAREPELAAAAVTGPLLPTSAVTGPLPALPTSAGQALPKKAGPALPTWAGEAFPEAGRPASGATSPLPASAPHSASAPLSAPLMSPPEATWPRTAPAGSMTPNGLVRRVPRARRPEAPARYGQADAQPGRKQSAERSAEQVRSMLNDFRSGAHRSTNTRDNQEN
jgi:signal transduction histidine kinase